MNSIKTIFDTYDMEQAISECIEAKKPISITERTGNNWQITKALIISGSFRDGLTIVKKEDNTETNSDGEVAVSFRRGHAKLIFNTRRRNNRLLWPSEMLKVSRRAYERQIPKETTTVRFWKDGHREQMYYGQLEDVSTGGMRVSVRSKEYEPGCYYVAIDHKEPITATAILRSEAETDDNRQFLSFQFIGLEFDKEAMQKLVRLTQKLSKTKRAATIRRRPFVASDS